MSELRLVDADELDYDAFSVLQRAAFAEVIARAGSSASYMTPAFYRHKFHPPEGLAKIALVYDDEGLVAANAMYPVCLRRGDQTVRGWQSCDTATAPRGRGQGYFMRCLDALRGALGPDQIFFGFPNGNSMRGFVKLGWESRGVVTTWVNPLALRLPGGLGPVDRVERFGAEFDALSDALARGVHRGRTHIERGAAYLNWRYVDHPAHQYDRFAFWFARRALGFVVSRTAPALGREVTVVMDLWGATPGVERVLLRRVAALAWEHRRPVMVLLDTGLAPSSALLGGFAPVPSKLLPKQQLLMGNVSPGGDQAAALFGAPWRAQTGDWDGF